MEPDEPARHHTPLQSPRRRGSVRVVRRPRNRFRIISAAVGAILPSIALAGGVVTDGTMGPQRTLTGPNHRVTADLGTRRGGNLFHSFQQLDLDKGQAVTFAGPTDVKNVLARVTGGRASSIDGTIVSEIAGANLYFINPHGIVFGKNARLDVSGSFVATTADTLKFADGGQFSARIPGDTVLSSAEPSAFGFLGPQASALRLRGEPGAQARLTVPEGSGVSLVAGEVEVRQAGVRAPGGWASLAAVQSGEVTIAPDQPGRVTGTSDGVLRGPITVRNASKVDTTGLVGGPIDVIGDDFSVIASEVKSIGLFGTSDDIGGTLAVDLSGRLSVVDGGRVVTLTTVVDPSLPNFGRAGDVIVRARDVETIRGGVIGSISVLGGDGGLVRVEADTIGIDGRNSAGQGGGIAAGSLFGGDAGTIDLKTRTLRITNGSELEAAAAGTGSGGNITIDADAVFMSADPFPGDPISRGIRSTSGDGPRGGDIRITTGSMHVEGTTGIFSTAIASGDAGNIRIDADSLYLGGDGRDSLIGITAATSATGLDQQGSPVRAGDAGDITINAGTVRLARNAAIVAAALPADDAGLAPGNAGNVTINADRLILNGAGGTVGRATVSAAALGTQLPAGAAGNVTLNVGLIRLFEGGAVSTETAGFGAAGRIDITARDLLVDGQPTEDSPSKISSSSNGGFVSGGDLSVVGGKVSVTNGGVIAASSQGDGSGGNVSIDADVLTVSGTPAIEDVGGAVVGAVAAGGAGNGGTVTINATSLFVQNGGLVTAAAVGGTGDGGLLRIRAGDVKVDGGPAGKDTGIAVGILAGGSGAGGRVDLSADGNVVVRRGGLIVAGTEGSGPGGDLAIAAGRGIYVNAGSVSVASGDLDADDEFIGTGPAGSAALAAPYLRIEGGSDVSAFSELSSGGSITLSGGRIDLLRSSLRVNAATTGGSVVMRFSDRIFVFQSQVNAVGGQTIGKIDIDPRFVILNQSSLLTDTSPGGGGNIEITTDVLLQDDSTITAAGEIIIDVLNADTDVTAGLLELRGDFIDEAARLKDACGPAVSEDFSSFVVSGRGFVPAAPGEPLPAPTTRPAGGGR